MFPSYFFNIYAPIKQTLMSVSVLILITSCSTSKEKKMTVPIPSNKSSDKDQQVPSLTMPAVRRMWVPDKIEGNRYEAGHYIYILEKTSQWSQSNDK